MLNLVLFGPPGSGKGTQAARLVQKYNLEHVSTGNLLRAEKSAGTPLGLEAKKFMDAGELVPDSVVIGMINNKLAEKASSVNGFIFDGFPRTIPQAEALDALLAERDMSITQMLALEVSEEELIRRLLDRGKTSGRADDTNKKTICNRISVYTRETAVVASYYKEQGKACHLSGEGSIESITQALMSEIDQLA